MDEMISKTLKALENNNFDVYYAENKQQVCETVKSLLDKGDKITSGGSQSLIESGVWDIITSDDYNFSDRNREGITPEERLAVFKETIGCDKFFCSANAVTQDGDIVNIDGAGNRVSFISFGPKTVIMIVGKNKIVENINEGFLRIKKIAAPKNAVRLKLDTPCAKLGHCVSLEKCQNPSMTDGCMSPYRICREYLVTSMQREKGRIKVIICGEDLGY